MKKVYLILLVGLIVSSCMSSSKLMQSGRYDAALDRAVKELRKNPDKTEDILALERTYSILNERTIERINFLKLDNNPRNLEELINLYSELKYRQTLVRTVLPLNLPDRVINYPYVNYDAEIIEAKNSAAGYFYDNAMKLMEQKTKEAYRQAHVEFKKAKTYSYNYQDTDKMIQKSKYDGISRVLIMVHNHTPIKLSDDFLNNLLTVKPEELDSEWVEYYFKDLDEAIMFDYYIVVNLRSFDISPDNTKDSDRLVKKRVQDGHEYMLDDRGNVAKDTAGNDIKVPRYVNLTCAIIETLQQKHAYIEGDVEFVSLNPQRILKKEPVGASNSFEHRSARAIGDLGALDEETLKLIDAKLLPFPDDGEMAMLATESLRMAVAQVIQKNKRLIK